MRKDMNKNFFINLSDKDMGKNFFVPVTLYDK